MLANIASSIASQNNAAPHKVNMPSPGTSGVSFTEMLSNEMHASPAAPTKNSASSASNTTGAAAQSGTKTSMCENCDNTSTTSKSVGGKKGAKQAQSDTQDNSAAAATAAALASVVNAPGKTDGATSAANSIDATAAAENIPMMDLVGAIATNAATQVDEFNAKIPLSDAQSNLPGITDPVSVIIAPQTNAAVAATQAETSKSNAQQSGEFEETLNKISDQNNTAAEKITATTTAMTATNTTLSGSESNTASDSNVNGADTSMQTVKTANQDLSLSQMNAIAPILTTPSNASAPISANTISPRLGSSAWDEAVGQKINWMVSSHQQSASLTLNPPDLGPLQVVLNVDNQHATATFTSHQPEVRAALENAIPKLREMLNQSGIQLGECNVNSQPKQQFAQNQRGASTHSGRSMGNETVSAMSAVSAVAILDQHSGAGLVDTFV